MITEEAARKLAQKVQSDLSKETAKVDKENQTYARYLNTLIQVESNLGVLNEALKNEGSFWKFSLEESQLSLHLREDAVKSENPVFDEINIGTFSYKTSDVQDVHFKTAEGKCYTLSSATMFASESEIDAILLQVISSALSNYLKKPSSHRL